MAGVFGRDHELAALDTMLADARAGRGRAAVVLGEPGIGKTRLAEAVAERAAAEGFSVAWGRCPDSEAPPYWPWSQVLRTLGAEADALFVADQAGGRPDLFASIARALERAAENGAAVLIEDAHWADASSIALLQFVVSVLPGLPILLVLTTRDDPTEMDADVWAGLTDLPPAVVRLALRGLDEPATVELVHTVAGTATPTALVREIHRRTGGNPFFVSEVARLYALRGEGGTMDVPAGVQQVLARRLARLSQAASETLTAAAVVGTPDAAVLAAVTDRSEDDVRLCLEEAAGARLLTRLDRGYTFAHDLVRETLYEQQAPGLRSRLHRRTAEALEATPAANPADLATQWARAEGTDAPRKSADYALDAARAAVARTGYEQAVRFYTWAHEGDAGDHIDVVIELGHAQVLAGALAEGCDTLARGAAMATDARRPEDAARAVLAMGTGVGGFEVDLSDERQAPLLEQALAAMPVDDSAVRAAVLARLSLLLAPRPDQAERRAALAREAVETARRVGDARTEVSALAATADALAGPDHVAERSESAERMVALATAVGDPALVLLARRMRLMALLEQGRLADVDAEIEAYARVAERLRLPLYQWPVPLWRGMRALMSGDVEAARTYSDEAAGVGERAGSENAEIMAFTLRVGANMLTTPSPDMLSEAENGFDRWMAGLPPAYRWAPAAWFARAGGLERARSLVRERLAAGIDDVPRDSEWLEMIWMAGEAGRLVGELEAVQLAYDALQPYAGLWVVDGIGGACYGVAAYELGRLAVALNRRDEAEAWFRTALDAHRRAGAQLLVQLSETALAELGAPGPLQPSPASEGGEFRRDGRVWRLTWRGENATVTDSKGMRDLAVLLARPARDVAAMDLVEAAGGPPAAGAQGDTGPVLDSRARSQYRARLVDLEEELADAEAHADAGRIAVLSAERDFLASELAAALGLGGRARTTGDAGERARKAVTMRVGTAVKAIAEVHPSLARHLRASVATGRFCSYQPEDDVTWRV